MRRATEAAQRLGHKAVLLVAMHPTTGVSASRPRRPGALWMPGPYEKSRLLARELVPAPFPAHMA